MKPSYVIFASTIVAGLGMLLLAGIDAHSTALELSIPMCIMAFSLGFGMAQRTNLVAVAVPKEDIGEASAILALVRNISGAFGVAIFSTILNNAINSNILSIARQSVLHATSLPLRRRRRRNSSPLSNSRLRLPVTPRFLKSPHGWLSSSAFTAFLIRLPKEHVSTEHVMILD